MDDLLLVSQKHLPVLEFESCMFDRLLERLKTGELLDDFVAPRETKPL